MYGIGWLGRLSSFVELVTLVPIECLCIDEISTKLDLLRSNGAIYRFIVRRKALYVGVVDVQCKGVLRVLQRGLCERSFFVKIVIVQRFLFYLILLCKSYLSKLNCLTFLPFYRIVSGDGAHNFRNVLRRRVAVAHWPQRTST